jgi:hypothetical protein
MAEKHFNEGGGKTESRPVHRGQGGPYIGARPGPYIGATSTGNWPVHRGHTARAPGPYIGAISRSTTWVARGWGN